MAGVAEAWEAEDVAAWVSRLGPGLRPYAAAFRCQQVDGACLLHLTDEEIKTDLGVTLLGPRKLLRRAIDSLQKAKSIPYDADTVDGGIVAQRESHIIDDIDDAGVNGSSFDSADVKRLADKVEHTHMAEYSIVDDHDDDDERPHDVVDVLRPETPDTRNNYYRERLISSHRVTFPTADEDSLSHVDASDEGEATAAVPGAALGTCEELTWRFRMLLRADALALARVVRENTDLRILTLHCNKLTCETTHIILSALVDHSSLEALRLSENPISKEGASAVARVLSSCSMLRELRVDSAELDDDSAAIIADALPHATSLRTLSLDCNNIHEHGAASLSAALPNTAIQHLSLCGNALGAAGVTVLALHLPEAPHLVQLSLAKVMMGDIGAASLAVALRNCNCIEVLDVARNGLSDCACAHIVDALLPLSLIHEEVVSEVSDDEDGDADEDDGFTTPPPVRALLMANNYASLRTARSLAAALAYPQLPLATLDVANCMLGPHGGTALAHGVRQSASLTHLDVRNNNIQDARFLLESIRACRTLQFVHMGYNRLPYAQDRLLCKIQDAQPGLEIGL
eukprot:jgi/Chlat1/1262/Chrsp115S01696